jgi:three-Cys-motif partner protein
MAMPDVLRGDDGLPVTKVGTWTQEKHERLVKYVDIAQGVRGMFARTENTYIELFCGPGRSIIEDTGETIDGSPILAARTAKESGMPYTDIHLADADPTYVDAVCKRMPDGVGRVHPYVGEAEKTVDEIVPRLNPLGLHFAFLDPYKLVLPFCILKKLASFKRIDMLIHVSIHDFQRNLRIYMDERGGPLDRFAPGWRDVVNQRGTDRNIRIAIFNHWLSLIRNLDMAASQGSDIEKVVGTNRQPLYWLVLVARHDRAHEFWNKIRNVSQQREFKF